VSGRDADWLIDLIDSWRHSPHPAGSVSQRPHAVDDVTSPWQPAAGQSVGRYADNLSDAPDAVCVADGESDPSRSPVLQQCATHTHRLAAR